MSSLYIWSQCLIIEAFTVHVKVSFITAAPYPLFSHNFVGSECIVSVANIGMTSCCFQGLERYFQLEHNFFTSLPDPVSL